MNLKQLLQHFTLELHELYDQEEIRSIFFLCAEHFSGLRRTDVLLNWEREEPASQQYIDLSEALKAGKPVQYLFGNTFFYGLPIKVNESVLIPRPETEELVEWILKDLSHDALVTPKPEVIDFGTGSGCIAISIKKHFPEAIVRAVDISEAAIKLAAENAELNGAILEFIQADMLNFKSTDHFDVIVSNPPYITNAEKKEMHQNVLDHEPHLALFVPDEKPLMFYEAVADFALSNLRKGGRLYFEINATLAEEMIAMLSDKSFVSIELKYDMQGKPRMLSAVLAE